MDRTSQITDRGRNLTERLADEARRFVVMFLYLWILFGLFVPHERIILDQRGINFTLHGFALVNALVLGKVMLVVEDLNLERWLRRGPLIYPILFESLLLSVLFIGCHVVEHLVKGIVKGETLGASLPTIGGGGLAGVVCVALILFVSLIPFFAFRTIGRELGPGRLNTMLFGTSVKNTGGMTAHSDSDGFYSRHRQQN